MATIDIPSPPKGLFANLVGFAGLVAVVVAVGGLTHNWWWSVLSGGVAAVGLAVIAQHNAEDTQKPADIPRIRRSA